MEKGRFAVFFLIVLTIWTAMNAYVLWRIWSLPSVQRVPRPLLLGLAAFLWASYLAARFLERAGIRPLANVLEWVGAHWLGSVFLAFVCLLVVDIVTGFGRWLPVNTLRSWALVGTTLLAVISFIQARRAPVVNEYSVALKDLPAELDGTTLAVISDTHLGTMIGADWVDARVAQVQALRPDLIILAGDIIEGDDDTNEAKIAARLRKLNAPLGVWAVTGNHEFFAGLPHSLKLLNDAGARVLRDQSVEVKPGLVLAGVDDLTVRRRYRRDGDFIEQALAKRAAGATVLLSHSPLYPERAARAGAGLMISGHTHAGQIWPFTYFVRSLYPLIHGRYEINGMKAIVCRGTGTWGPRMRLWGRGEILKITLRSPAKNEVAAD